MSELNQLLLELNHKKNFNEYDYYISKSNYFAFNIIDKWPKWEKKILNITGEKFSGKTHLANIFKSKTKALLINADKIDEKIFNKIKLFESIIIDDFEKFNDERLIYSIFNLIEQDNKFIIVTSVKPIVNITFDLKDLRSRTKNFILLNIEKPDDELIFAIILKNFSDRQITLDDKFIQFIIKRIERSYSKIYDFIYKIDQLSLKKKKSIDLSIIKEVLGE